MNLTRHIPNAITCANLLCGCTGIMYAFTDRMDYAVYCIWLAMLFDFFDGFAARILKVSGPMGKQLDSLADMVTFGALPALMLFQFMQHQEISPLNYISFLVAVFSALRLAKFNIDENQSDKFIGVPTPANALFISGLFFIMKDVQVLDHSFLVGVSVICAYWLIMPVELLALKFKNFAFRDNLFKYILILGSMALLAFLKFAALPVVILYYIVLSVINNAFSKQ